MNFFNLALRGLARNRRRSMATLLAIAFGFAAITLFAGYTHNVYSGLARQSIHGELIGHLTLSKRGMKREGKLNPERYLMTAAELTAVSKLLYQEPHVRFVAPRLALNGLISNGRASTIFIAEGIEPLAMKTLQEGLITAREVSAGVPLSFIKKLDPAHDDVVELSAGLVDLLHLSIGAQASVLTSTLSGQANAADMTVGGQFNTGNAGSNDKFAYVPLAFARSLLDAEGRADRLTILLDDSNQTEVTRTRLQQKLHAAGFDVEIQTWQELSDFYQQVHNMFDMIFGFIFSIVLTVVLISVANSMSMTVIERTREIGTLRAIGLKQRGVVRLFTTEAMLLSVSGCGTGFLIALGVQFGINAAHISYIPPNSVSAVPLLVDMDSVRIVLTLLLMVVIGTGAAYMPARRASKKIIIDALAYV